MCIRDRNPVNEQEESARVRMGAKRESDHVQHHLTFRSLLSSSDGGEVVSAQERTARAPTVISRDQHLKRTTHLLTVARADVEHRSVAARDDRGGRVLKREVVVDDEKR